MENNNKIDKEEQIHKKTVSACIMAILEEYSSPSHRLSIEEIVNLIPMYGYTAERRAVSDHLIKLCDIFDGTDKQIYYSQMGGAYNKRTGFYLNPDPKINKGELDTLINFVKYNKNIKPRTKKSLINRLISVGPYDYEYTKGLMIDENSFNESYDDFFGNIEIVNSAIKNRHKISFDLFEYDSKALFDKVSDDIIFFNPYSVVSKNDRYYVIGVVEGESELEHFRLDKMKYVQEENMNITIIHSLLCEIKPYMDAHPSMAAGRSIRIVIKIKNKSLWKAADSFGTNFSIIENKQAEEGYLIISVNSVEEDAFRWALENSDVAEIIEPQSLRNKIKSTCKYLSKRYNYTSEDSYYDEISRMDSHYHDFKCRDFDLSRKTEFRHIDPQLVYLRNNNLNSVSFVENYKNLMAFEIIDNPVKDLSMLARLPKVQLLHIRNTDITSVSFIKDMKSLRALKLCGNSKIEDLSPLFQCKNLEYLSLGKEELKKTDIEKLKNSNSKLSIIENDKYYFSLINPAISFRTDIDGH